MGDFFDLNNDGKIDNFEGAMRWDMIDHMMKDSPSADTGSSSGRLASAGTGRPVFTRQEFAYGIINQALAEGASAETIEKALKKCRDVLAEEPPKEPQLRFSKWFVIGAVIGVLTLIVGILVKNPVTTIGSFVLWWFFSLPGIEENSAASRFYQRQKAAYPLRRAYAEEYAEKLEAALKEKTAAEAKEHGNNGPAE